MSEEVAEIFSKHIFSSEYEDLSEKTIKQLKVFLFVLDRQPHLLSHYLQFLLNLF